MKTKPKILLFCGSKKPAPSEPNKKSAAREILKLIESHIGLHIKTIFLDVRDLNLPWFDGRNIKEYGSKDLLLVKRTIEMSDCTIISVPAYWGGISGVMKNVLDLLGGPAYDNEASITPFHKKIVALLVVGDNNNSAFNAASQLRTILSSMGAITMNPQVVIGNPRNIVDPQQFLQQLKNFGESVLQAVETSS